MDGEFVIEETTGITTDAVGGGNVLILGNDRAGLLQVAEGAVDAIGAVPDVHHAVPRRHRPLRAPRSARKYKGMVASTNDAFCPTLRGRVKTELGPDTVAVLEIVIDGLTSKSVADAMRAGLKSVIENGAAKGVTRVTRRQLRRQARPTPLQAAGAAAMSGLTVPPQRGARGAARPFAPDAEARCRRRRSPRS